MLGWRNVPTNNSTIGPIAKSGEPKVVQALAVRRDLDLRITDSRGDAWTATITEVVSRNRQRIVVRNSGRP